MEYLLVVFRVKGGIELSCCEAHAVFRLHIEHTVAHIIDGYIGGTIWPVCLDALYALRHSHGLKKIVDLAHSLVAFEFGEPLFETAGYKLDGSELLLAYRAILLTCPGITIYECNFILEGLGLPALAKSYIRKHE